jgi:hypothetical protein
MTTLVHYACDVGSTRKGNFGWARAERAGTHLEVRASPDVDVLVKSILADLANQATSVTIGIESPLFLPVPDDARDLGVGREGEKDRSCFAQAGAYVTTLGLHQFGFVLRRTRRKGIGATLDWKTWIPQPSTVLFWEAFVSGPAHSPRDDAEGHLRDASTAAAFFDVALATARKAGNPVRVPGGTTPLSLAGLALVWSGWSQDVSLLSRDDLVVKPETAFTGNIVRVP